MIASPERDAFVRAGLTLALVAACWPVWGAGGWLAELLGLGALDLPVRVCAVFLFLSAAESGLARVLSGRSRGAEPTAE